MILRHKLWYFYFNYCTLLNSLPYIYIGDDKRSAKNSFIYIKQSISIKFNLKWCICCRINNAPYTFFYIMGYSMYFWIFASFSWYLYEWSLIIYFEIFNKSLEIICPSLLYPSKNVSERNWRVLNCFLINNITYFPT